MDLNAIANAIGYGTGKQARDQLAAIADLRDKLPDPATIPPIMASTDAARNWLIASFGCDSETNTDWHIVTDNVRASETPNAALVQGAKDDAETMAAIVNAYRLGLLILRPAFTQKD